MNIGNTGSLINDQCAYDDALTESITPLNYRLDPTQISNCKKCLSVVGPRGNHSVSSVGTNVVAPRQANVDVESILSNRNVKTSKCKRGKVNPVDISTFDIKDAVMCDNYLDKVSSRLTNPLAQYRGMSVNRFYDLHRDPQRNIYFDSAVNTQLQAKDSFVSKIPSLFGGSALPPVPTEQARKCKYSYTCDN
tara:strand:+ start:1029 stop:1604 length:576 start_codon:yes stop_codon:yes gene_type:complete